MTFGKDRVVVFLDYGALAVLSAGIFLLDVLTPIGVAIWSLYLLPLGLTFRLPRERAPFYFCILVAALSLAGFLFSPPGAWLPYDAVNRIVGLSAMWGFAFVAVRYKRSQAALFSAEAGRERMMRDLSAEIDRREAAESIQVLATAEVEELSQDKAQALAARREAEEDALAARIRLDAIVHSAMDAIITVDEAQEIVLFNRAAEDMFQCKARDVLGQPLDRFIPVRFRERHRDHIRAFGKSGVTSRRMGSLGVITGLRSNGEEFPVEAAISQIGIHGGRFYTVIIRDITERNRVQEALHESERVHRTLLSNLSGMAYRRRHDEDWTMEFASEGCKVLTGYGSGELVRISGVSFRALVHPDDWMAVRDTVQHKLEARESFNSEYRIRAADGTEKWVWDQAQGIFSPDGRLLAVEGFVNDITARKRAETALQEAQARFEDIFESSKDAIGYVSLDGKIVLANESFARLTGYTRDELVNKTHRDLTPEECHAIQAREVATVLRTGEPTEYEREFIRKDGSRVPVAVTLSMVKGDSIKPAGVAAIVRDITERRRTEQALRESEERFRQMADTVEEVIWIKALHPEQVLYVSPAFARIWGLSPDDLYRDPQAWMKAIHAEERVQVGERFARWITDEGRSTDYDVEYRIVRPDGTIRWIHDRGSLIRNKGGRIYRATGIAEDITGRKTAEVLLSQSEQRYRQLVEVSPDAIFINRGDRIVFINREGLELLGAISPDQILGRSPFEFIHPDSHEQARDRIRQLMEGLEQVPLVEEKFVRVDGSIVDVEVTAARYIDQQEPAIQVVLRDITQRKRLQEQLRRTERVAELGTLASGMAHEIGTPMNVILGRAEYLMNRTSDEPIKKGLQTIVSQVERITRVMNQLLSFARRRTPERRAVDLREVVESTVEMFHERLARYQIEVEMDFEEGCPPVHADADQMSQVLINLLMNAIHALPDGGRVRVATRHVDPDMVQLILADTGSGMPSDVMAKIFDPFFTTKEFGAGTGLGLTVVKGIMEEHGGSISVESEPGKGTTFTLILPRNG